MVLRYVFRHIPRALAKSLLSLLLAAALIAALGQFTLVVRSNRALVEEMYDTVEVLANVVNRSGSIGTRVPYTAIEMLNEAGFASEYYAESRGPCRWVTPDLGSTQYSLHSFTDPAEFGKARGITYAEGYGDETFLLSDEKLCVISEKAAAELGLGLGDSIWISGASDGKRLEKMSSGYYGIEFTIIGTYESGLGLYDVLTPFWSMNFTRFAYYLSDYDGSGYARKTWFRIDNDLLRDEAAYKDAPNEVLANAENDSISGLALMVQDDEVKNVVEPLDRNTDLLELLLPIICVVVMIIGAAIPGLVIIQSAKEAAIMRVLGTAKSKVRAVLTLEQMLLCALGLIVGVAGLAAAHGFSADIMRCIAEIALYSAGYAALCLVTCLVCSVSVSEGKPLELLQTKE